MADDIKLVVGVDYTELTGLIRTTGQTKTALKSIAQTFSRTGNQSQYMRSINQVVRAQNNLDESSRLSRSEIMKLGAEMRQQTKFADALAIATGKVSTSQKASIANQMAATKASNNLGVVTQQAGYQVSDFIVQIQSGTNGFVAFGQQASQLVGVLPLVANRIGLTAKAAIGLSASLGIIIPIITMVGAALTRTMGEAKKNADVMGDLERATSLYVDSANRARSSVSDLEKDFGALAIMAKELYGYQKELAQIKAVDAVSSAMQELTKQFGDFGQVSVAELQKAYDNINGLTDGVEVLGNSFDDMAAESTGGLKEIEDKLINLEKILGVDSDKALLFAFNLAKLNEAADLDETILALGNIKIDFDNITGGIENATEEQRSLMQLIVNAAMQSLKLRANMDDLAPSIKRSSKAFEDISTHIQRYGDGIDGLSREFIGFDRFLTDEQINSIKRATNDILMFGDGLDTLYDMTPKTAKAVEDVTKEILAFGDGLDYIVEISPDVIKSVRDLTSEILMFGDGLDSLPDPFEKIRQSVTDVTKEIMMFGDGLEDAFVPPDEKKTKGGKTKSMASIIKGMEEQANLQRKLVGLSDQEADYLQILYNLKEQNKTASGKMTEAELIRSAERIAAINAETAAMEAQMQKIQDVADSFETHFGDALMGIVTDFDFLNDSIEDFGYNAEQVFKNMAREIIKELYRIFVVKKITGFISGAVGDIGSLYQGSTGFMQFSGGGYTGSGPRSGGLDGKGGFLAMLHPKETVIDHTKGQSAEGVTVVQNINISTGVQQTVRNEIRTLMPQIANSAKAAVSDAKRRGGSYGRALA